MQEKLKTNSNLILDQPVALILNDFIYFTDFI